VIWRGLPAFFLHQFQGVMGMHTAIDERSTGKQDTAPDAVLTMNQYALASLHMFMSPASSLHHLLDGQRLRIGSGQVQ